MGRFGGDFLQKKAEKSLLDDSEKTVEEIRKDFGKDITITFNLIAENPRITAEELAKK